MNLQTEEIEFENQLVDISPVGIHLKKFEPGIYFPNILNGSGQGYLVWVRFSR